MPTSAIKPRRPSPALVVAVLALFVALGGTGYAAVQINGKDIKNRSIAGKKLKNKTITAPKLKNKTITAAKLRDNTITAAKLRGSSITGAKVRPNTLTGAQIDESTLGQVPNAANAASLGGKSASSYAEGDVEITNGYTEIPVLGESRHFNLPLGRFELNCQNGIASADGRYRNTTPGDAQVWRTYTTPAAASTLVDNAIANGNYGLAFDDPISAKIDVRKGSSFATLEYFSVDDGGCRFRWTLTQGQL